MSTRSKVWTGITAFWVLCLIGELRNGLPDDAPQAGAWSMGCLLGIALIFGSVWVAWSSRHDA